MSDFRLTLNNFSALLKSLPKVVGGFTHVVFCNDGCLYANSPSGSAKVSLPGSLGIGTTPSAVPIQAILSAVDGKKSPSFSFEDGVLSVREPNYLVQLSTQDIPTFSKPQPIDVAPTVLTSKTWATIKDILPKLSLDKIHPSQPDANLTLRKSGLNLFIGVQDKYQFAFFTFKTDDESDDCEFQLPYPAAAVLLNNEMTSKTEIRLGSGVSWTNTVLHGYPVVLQSVWPEDEQSAPIEVVYEKAKALRSMQGDTVKISKDVLSAALVNTRSISLEDTRVSLSFKGTQCLISAESSSGSAKSKIPTQSAPDSPFQFQIELKFLTSFVSRMPDDFELTYADGLIKVRSGKLTYISATSL